MADLTATQLHWLHDKVGTPPSDAELQAHFDQTDSVRDAAIAVLAARRRVLLDTPLKVNIAGVASVDTAENVKAIERDIAALAKLDDDPSSDPDEDAHGFGDSPGVFERQRLVRARRR